MKIDEVVQILKVAHRVVDAEWKKLTPERRSKICDNIMKRAAKRAAQKKGRCEKGGKS